ncbi:E3 ubiquitin-protein ligase RNF220 like protein [Argiope bruennichi]|uniref:E3 ubiquitin-protein ligase RNF220 like protein n=1 Tax=Argiope bruennichi TaxID=94029 RepID=A0A8T0EK36_ARGBR|nr:E3 ubiquitin-protein ligase RNF220 like protein [Argiope bruennichi]
MEMQSDLTLELEKETVTDKSKYITDSSDSSILSTMKHKSIPDMEIDRIEPLTNGLNKILADRNLLKTAHDLQKIPLKQGYSRTKVNEYTENLKNGINCPSCKLWICGTTEELNNHVLVCFQTIESNEHINVEDDEDDNESFEEYEFGDQTRIRAISFVPGGYRSLQGQIAKRSRVDEDEDLDLDVIRDKNEEDKASDQLRKAVLVDPSIQPHVLESRKWTTNDDVSDSQVNSSEVSSASRDDKNDDKQPAEQNDTVSGHIISSLKEKIRDLGDQSKNVKCLICMEPYTKPVVSTTCWHVHCEECWLMTLGVKKLCPQCNMIVFPTDLRKIYL